MKFIIFFSLKIDAFFKIPQCPSHVFFNDYEMMLKIHEIIVSDLSKPIPPIKVLASSVAMSQTKFRNLFFTIYGTTIYQYHLNLRMELAKKLLLDNRYSIVQIAYKTGFIRSQSFAKVFQKRFGITASAFRAEYRNNIH